MHVVYSFDTGGLENGVVNLINHLPPESFRHSIVALTRCAPSFAARIRCEGVELIDLNKSPGHSVRLYPALSRLFRARRPVIVHSRNLAALEAQVPAWLAGVPVRIHGEHGWDVSDPDGAGKRNRLLRRVFSPFVGRYVALSRHIEQYLHQQVGIATRRVVRICNGVDVARFRPAAGGERDGLTGSPFDDPRLVVFGTVGRLQPVKNQSGLIAAFAQLVRNGADAARLMIVGDGPLRATLEAEVERCGLAGKVWFAGERADVPEVMRAMDVFVLPSVAEGISNTILEAMASGLPVVATRVGGNPELVIDGETGVLVPAGHVDALARGLAAYAGDSGLRADHGRAARQRAETGFSIETMVAAYNEMYQAGLVAKRAAVGLEPSA